MGACQIRQASHFYKRIPRESENQFWINKIQIHHFEQIVNRIKKGYQEDFKQKQTEFQAKIQAKLNVVKKRFQEQIDECTKAKRRDKVKQLEEELLEIQQEFQDLRVETIAALEDIKDQKNSQFIKFYTNIQTQLKRKEKHVPLSVYLCQQTVKEIYETWKITHQNEIKQAKEDLEKEFQKRQEKTEYYKTRFSCAMDQQRLEELGQRVPFQNELLQQGAENPFFCRLLSF